MRLLDIRRNNCYIANDVGLSNILYRERSKELTRRKPVERTRRTVVGTTLVCSELPTKVGERKERMTAIETFLVFAVTAFDLTVVSGSIRPNELVLNAQSEGSYFKKRRDVALACRETIGKLEAVVCLNTFNRYTSPRVPSNEFLKKIGRRVCALFTVRCQEAKSGKLIYSGVLIQSKLRIGNTASWNNFDIHLYSLPRISHLLVRFWYITLFSLFLFEHTKPFHDTIQDFRSAGIASIFQAMPQLDHSQIGISTAHILNKLYFIWRMLRWMVFWTFRLRL